MDVDHGSWKKSGQKKHLKAENNDLRWENLRQQLGIEDIEEDIEGIEDIVKQTDWNGIDIELSRKQKEARLGPGLKVIKPGTKQLCAWPTIYNLHGYNDKGIRKLWSQKLYAMEKDNFL